MDDHRALTPPTWPIRRQELVDLERLSLRRFLEANRGRFPAGGRVLDFGAGKPGTCASPEPYRDVVEGQGALYVPYDVGDPAPRGPFHVVLCTQVLQLLPDPPATLARFRALAPDGVLVLTAPGAWEERPRADGDDHRFTARGLEALCRATGWTVEVLERRWVIPGVDFAIAAGYGLIAR